MRADPFIKSTYVQKIISVAETSVIFYSFFFQLSFLLMLSCPTFKLSPSQ